MQDHHVSSTELPHRIAGGHVVASHWIFRQDIRFVGPTASDFDLTKGQMDKNVPVHIIFYSSPLDQSIISSKCQCLQEISKLFNFHRQTAADIVNGIEIIFESPGAGLR
ncbi:hypothetical protein V6N11_021181 [Hibiscus sabdariffa]|uniref:Uncharacterized protein n=1 Tax=Hibiscus sabdariffa TaxID=183260 RepID=A0ABR2NLP6_9ROSI